MNLRSLFSAASQGLWSGLSFLVAIVVMRYTSMEAFGWFTIGVAVKQFLLMPLSAVVLTPLTVASGRQAVDNLRDRNLHHNVIGIFQVISAVFLLLSLAVGWIFAQPAIQFAVFVVGGLAVELQRRINFISARSSRDLIGGIVNAGGVLVGLLLLKEFNELTVPNVFLIVGSVNLLWAISCDLRHWLTYSTQLATSELIELWKIGRWALGSNVAGYVYSQASTFYTLFIVGPAGVAILELGRQLVTVVQVLMQGMANIWQPILARTAATEGPRQLIRQVWRITRNQTAMAAVVLMVILVTIPYLLPLLIPGKEHDYQLAIPIAWITALALLLQMLWQHASFSVIALGKPEYGFITRIAAVLVLLPIGFALTYFDGVTGAAWSRVIGEAFVLVVTTMMLYRAAKAREQVMEATPALSLEPSRHAD